MIALPTLLYPCSSNQPAFVKKLYTLGMVRRKLIRDKESIPNIKTLGFRLDGSMESPLGGGLY